ncbi:MAG: hypothetical protein E7425_12135 [Ruminococcaceae bacterium]|nr:hypothetical protein [Oscillospiraceae bacterium]
MDYKEVLARRHSTRRFSSRPVDNNLLLQIVREASSAPAWADSQEYKAYIATGDMARFLRSRYADAPKNSAGLSDYSFTNREDWTEREMSAMKEFERKVGDYMGEDYDDFFAAQGRLFDAPAICFLTLPKDASKWAKSDLGAFEMLLLLSAANQGLDTIVAQAFVKYPEIVRKHMKIPEAEDLIIGIGLGYGVREDKLNSFHAPKKPLGKLLTIKETGAPVKGEQW